MANRTVSVSVKPPENLRAGLVSIGLPVYNGARYLREALDALIAQDYPDFEIIISDNASEDETETISREYAARDSRIRYSRAEQNNGPLWNAVHVYQQARGEYFLLGAHDDLRHPQYLSRCVAELERNPNALLCCTGVRVIDEHGHDITETSLIERCLPVGATRRERLAAVLRGCNGLHIYSLLRTPALAETKFGNYMWAGDVVVLAEMCLRGEVAQVPESLFAYRFFHDKTDDDRARLLSTSDVSVKICWSNFIADLIDGVHRSPLSLTERLSLEWMIARELCFPNAMIDREITQEGFAPVRRAIGDGNYRRAATLVIIALLRGTVALLQKGVRFGKRIINSVRYREPRLKGLVTRSAGADRQMHTKRHENADAASVDQP